MACGERYTLILLVESAHSYCIDSFDIRKTTTNYINLYGSLLK